MGWGWFSLPGHHTRLWQDTLQVEQCPLEAYEDAADMQELSGLLDTHTELEFEDYPWSSIRRIILRIRCTLNP